MNIFRLMAIAAVVCFVACDKDDSEDNNSATGNGNYWYRTQMVSGGIKSITNDNYTTEYDKNGRIISSRTSYMEESYTYNSDGLPTKIVTKQLNDGGAVQSTEIKSFEYNNKGKFCPMAMSPGNVFHIYEIGLLPGLSKITWSGSPDVSAVMEYNFSGDKLTIHTSGTYFDFSDFDDIVFTYSGDYPVSMNSPREFIGPITYRENGMFETFTEGFKEGDIVYMERTSTTSNKFNNVMLKEREVSKYYDSSTGVLYNTETIVNTYNEHGDIVLVETTNTMVGSENYREVSTYEYDSKGNWTKVTTTLYADGRKVNEWVNERTVVYY